MIVKNGQLVGTGMTRELIAEGTILADGTVQTILNETASKIEIVDGWLQVDAMQAGDTLKVATTYNIGYGDITHASEEYSGAQTKASIFLSSRILKTGAVYKVTIQQTAGTNRTYKYQFFREVA